MNDYTTSNETLMVHFCSKFQSVLPKSFYDQRNQRSIKINPNLLPELREKVKSIDAKRVKAISIGFNLDIPFLPKKRFQEIIDQIHANFDDHEIHIYEGLSPSTRGKWMKDARTQIVGDYQHSN